MDLVPLESLSRSTGALLAGALAHAHAAGRASRSVVLVEGLSDKAAIETLASRGDRDLHREGVSVIAIAGATNIGQFLEILGPHGYDRALAGLCDLAEEQAFQEALAAAGLGRARSRAEMEKLGFFVCNADLEQELITSLGVPGVMGVVEELGEAAKFRSFQNQPAQRSRPVEAQLRRFLGTQSGRKVRYGGALAAALTPEQVPHALAGVLASV
jgi:hypothetical protein